MKNRFKIKYSGTKITIIKGSKDTDIKFFKGNDGNGKISKYDILVSDNYHKVIRTALENVEKIPIGVHDVLYNFIYDTIITFSDIGFGICKNEWIDDGLVSENDTHEEILNKMDIDDLSTSILMVDVDGKIVKKWAGKNFTINISDKSKEAYKEILESIDISSLVHGIGSTEEERYFSMIDQLYKQSSTSDVDPDLPPYMKSNFKDKLDIVGNKINNQREFDIYIMLMSASKQKDMSYNDKLDDKLRLKHNAIVSIIPKLMDGNYFLPTFVEAINS